MNNIKEKIIKSLEWRYATKVFDAGKIVSEDNINTILQAARLSPSSVGLEMWKFIVVKNSEIRNKIKEASYGQPQITDASHLVILTCRTDAEVSSKKERLERTSKIENINEDKLTGLKEMIENTINMKLSNGSLNSWIQSQVYIPLGIMIETAALLEIDTCPMEGFQPDKIDEILNLKEKNLKSVAMITIGYRGSDPTSSRPKVRRDFNDVIEFI